MLSCITGKSISLRCLQIGGIERSDECAVQAWEIRLRQNYGYPRLGAPVILSQPNLNKSVSLRPMQQINLGRAGPAHDRRLTITRKAHERFD
jgi:hypothetical protein